MICKYCGKETSTVLCEHCGVNVVWYNKYGCQSDLDYTELLEVSNSLQTESNDVEKLIDDMFIPDGSGD